MPGTIYGDQFAGAFNVKISNCIYCFAHLESKWLSLFRFPDVFCFIPNVFVSMSWKLLIELRYMNQFRIFFYETFGFNTSSWSKCIFIGVLPRWRCVNLKLFHKFTWTLNSHLRNIHKVFEVEVRLFCKFAWIFSKSFFSVKSRKRIHNLLKCI